MICPNCNKENKDGMKFCVGCGSALSQLVPQIEKKEKKSKGSAILIACLLAAILLLSSVIVVIIKYNGGIKGFFGDTDKAQLEAESGSVKDESESGEEFTETVGDVAVSGEYLSRPALLGDSALVDETLSVTPAVPEYKVASDFSNVDNIDRNQWVLNNDWVKSRLMNEGFYVSSYDSADEFYWEYENNRYFQRPSFVTVDSLMHTYHIYFSSLLKSVEKDYVSKDLKTLSELMLDNSIEQYKELKGTEWESAARRNVGYFAVGASLLGSKVSVPQSLQEDVTVEIQRVCNASEMDESRLFDKVFEDYTQYKPRGYYEGDATLEPYFRAMMWYGRMPFEQQDEDSDRSAVLVTLAMQGDAYTYWEKIYSITSFFCGASDDMGYCEYLPIIQSVYGTDVTIDKLVGDAESWKTFHALTGKLKPPAINSIVVDKGESIEIVSFRFMGQRFTIDADIMQNLIYPNVEANSSGDDRMLPSTLDAMAALGSDRAYELLKEDGATDYKYFTENMEKLQNAYSNKDADIWSASLYSGWLNTLTPLLEEKGEGYPMFMQNESWTTKQLETFAGSYTELKHDTILYSKQVMAEMGGDDDTVYDDRGYVQPEPVVYARFANLATKTKDGLKKYDAISENDAKNLETLAELATYLKTISEKELQNQSLTDDEYEIIRSYGGNLEHFWKDAMIVMTGEDYPNSQLYPCPVVADIATDPNGAVLEVGNGGAATIYVLVPVEGSLRIATGTVYSFYEFEWPQNDRLTDTEWKKLLGMEMNDDGSYNYDRVGLPEKPDWTMEYREKKDW